MDWTDVEEIKEGQLRSCRKIKSISIPNSVTKMGNRAFEHCRSLQSIKISNTSSITIIPPYSFHYCRNLQKIELPDALTEIGDCAFHNCVRLTSIIIPKSVRKIGHSAFYSNKVLHSISIPDGVTKIETDTFANCSALRSIIIPSSVKEIGAYAFSFCRSLYYVYIPTLIESIREGAFLGCWSLRCIVLPPQMSNLSGDVFENCEALFGRRHRDHHSTEHWLRMRFDNLPLHEACYDPNLTLERLSSLLINYDHIMTESWKDDMDMTALHILCCNPNATPQMIRVLKQARPQEVDCTNISGSLPLGIFLMSKNILSQKELEISPMDHFTEWTHQRHALSLDILSLVDHDRPPVEPNQIMEALLAFGLKGNVLDGLLEFLPEKDFCVSLIVTAASKPQCGLDALFLLAMKQPNSFCQ